MVPDPEIVVLGPKPLPLVWETSNPTGAVTVMPGTETEISLPETVKVVSLEGVP